MNFDVVILGGGVVGLTQALALAQRGFQVALVESGSLSLPLPADLRVSALNRASEQGFTELGLWSQVPVAAYQRMALFEATGPCVIDFDAAQIAEANLGYIVENQALRSALLQALQQSSVQLIPGCKPVNYRAELKQLELDSGQILAASLFIGAEGANSWLRQQASLGLSSRDYGQSALVCQLRCQQNHQTTARQRFFDTGPLALLPLQDPQQVSIVWSLLPERAKHLLAMPVAEFEQQLNQAASGLLGQLQLVSARQIFPLTARHAQSYGNNGVVLVGDAAHSIHPMAGLGLNLGLQDVFALTRHLAAARQKSRSLSSASLIAAYQRERRLANQSVLAAMASLHWLFGPQPKVVRLLRHQAMQLLQHWSTAKQHMARLALTGV